MHQTEEQTEEQQQPEKDLGEGSRAEIEEWEGPLQKAFEALKLNEPRQNGRNSKEVEQELDADDVGKVMFDNVQKAENIIRPIINATPCEEYRTMGVVATPRWNFALALAYVGQRMAIPVTIVCRGRTRQSKSNDNVDAIAGAGTIGLEVIEQVPDVDAIVVPVGSGSLITGMAVAVKHLRPDITIIVRSYLLQMVIYRHC
ncbi:unnamed protein product [Soboliphyme baturini]|uniref:L-serine deaminase n=1 Tax=Soboliphyme baturini TaxID=241478 RepID=A0A183J2F2_9BILA|nr:unnamed protein product [Soboliphyme baturini]